MSHNDLHPIRSDPSQVLCGNRSTDLGSEDNVRPVQEGNLTAPYGHNGIGGQAHPSGQYIIPQDVGHCDERIFSTGCFVRPDHQDSAISENREVTHMVSNAEVT